MTESQRQLQEINQAWPYLDEKTRKEIFRMVAFGVFQKTRRIDPCVTVWDLIVGAWLVYTAK